MAVLGTVAGAWQPAAMAFLLRVIINAVAIWVATRLVDGLEVVGGEDTTTTVLVHLGLGLLFGLVNAVVKPVVKVLAFPLYVLTLGLFTLVVNALMLLLTGWLSEQTAYGLRVEIFATAVIGAFVVSDVSLVLSLVIPGARDGHGRRGRRRDR